jgi:hypothetical protein
MWSIAGRSKVGLSLSRTRALSRITCELFGNKEEGNSKRGNGDTAMWWATLRRFALPSAMHGFRQVDVRAGRYGDGFVSSPIPRFARSLTSEIRDSDGDEELDAASVSL